VFCIPHVFCQGSNPDENRRVRNVLIQSAEIVQGNCGKRFSTLRKGPDYCVTFDVPTCFDSASHPTPNAKALQALLNCLAAINLIYLEFRPGGCIPPLYESGVVYGRTQIWDSIPALYQRGYGDCKSLTAALIAEYAAQGIKSRPVFRWAVDSEKQTQYHILVLSPQGFEDPSKVCGMDKDENAYFKRTG
jgi:hypothetical protein